MPLPFHLPPPGEMRRMDPARDLNAVATLMEDAFELKQDPEGHVIIENMRQHARLLSRADSGLLDRMVARASWADGFVWEDEGQVVGNVTLIPHMDGLKRMMMIANVSVREDYRGMGIARQLTEVGIQRCRQSGLREVYLQVKHSNTTAIQLYRSMGFETLHSVSLWRLRPSAFLPQFTNSASGYAVSSRKLHDWQIQKDWLSNTYPQRTRWYANVSFGALSPATWLNPFSWPQAMEFTHFAMRKNTELIGVLSWQNHLSRTDHLLLALPPNLNKADENERARDLLRHFVSNAWRQNNVNLEYPMGCATQGIQDAGLTLAYDLDWMALKL